MYAVCRLESAMWHWNSSIMNYIEECCRKEYQRPNHTQHVHRGSSGVVSGERPNVGVERYHRVNYWEWHLARGKLSRQDITCGAD